jgi:hypothetical protein
MDSAASAADAQAFADQMDQVLAQLRERLAPDDYRLVRQLLYLADLATVAACTAAEQRLLDAFIAHFPDRVLALQAVLTHVRATNADCDTFRGLPAGRHGA